MTTHTPEEWTELGPELLEALERISQMSPGGPHLSAKDGMGAALTTVDRMRDLARAAIAKAKGEPQ